MPPLVVLYAGRSRDFVDYFNSAGVATEPTAFDGRSDYKAFQDNGVAAGGLFSGAEVAKSAAQVAKWGGELGVPFDHCYHQACDDITNLDLAGYDVLADGGAHVLALLAEDPDLRDSLGGGGATAATASKKRLTAAQKRRLKARKAKMAEYRGSKLAR